MPGHDIIVVGASAGGVEALMTLMAGLPAGLPAVVMVVLHVPAQSPSALPEILSRSGPLPAIHPTDGTPLTPGQIYVAPPDHHLLVEAGQICVVRGPRENRHRPAVDPLFRSAALAYGPRVVGVVLTGALDDGTAGLHAVKQRGGLAVVQDPGEALYPGMPRSALEHVAVDFRLPLAAIAPLLVRLAVEPAPVEGAQPVPDEMIYETGIARLDPAALENDARPGTPSVFSCPECGGVLWEMPDSELTRFRCRVGHAFSLGSILAEQSEAVETALWTALKVLEERVTLLRRMARTAAAAGRTTLAGYFDTQAEETGQQALLVRQVVVHDRASTLAEFAAAGSRTDPAGGTAPPAPVSQPLLDNA